MNVFEPLFLLLALLALLTLMTVAGLVVTGRFARAGRILRRLGLGVVAYMTVVIVVTVVTPRRVYQVGDAQCFDDWCVTVTGVQRAEAGTSRELDVALQLANRARRVPMAETGTVVYLSDASGDRYDPLPDPDAVPLATRLQPGEAIVVHRRFRIPLTARDVGLVYTHEGGFPIGWLIITEGGWFQRPPIVRID